MTHTSSRESGSAFFIIMIAIAMLATLSFIVAKGGRTGVESISDDQARLAARDITSYGNSLVFAFQKLKLRGCQEADLSVYHAKNFSWSTYTNNSAPSDKSCHIYEIAGGGVNSLEVMDNWFAGGFSSEYWSYNRVNGLTGVGTAAPELLFFLGGLKKPICVEINNILGVGEKNAEPVATAIQDSLEFRGSFPASASTIINNSTLNGKTAFCLKDTDNHYKFIQVVLVR